MEIVRWDFVLKEADRLKSLNDPLLYEEIVDRMRNEMKILCAYEDPCKDQGGFIRVIYCIEISNPLFDFFFNSSCGYRSFYYISEYQGLEANRYLIDNLMSDLLKFNSPLEKDFAKESLKSDSAKVWLTEIPKEGETDHCELCSGEWTFATNREAEILNNRWEKDGDNDLSIWGRKAPYLTKLKIFGAFLNANGDEFIPSRKKHRSLDIHDYGWS